MEEVYKDRDQFASLVREVAAPDVGRMGIEVLSFTIKDVYDNVTYLASLGNYLPKYIFDYHFLQMFVNVHPRLDFVNKLRSLNRVSRMLA